MIGCLIHHLHTIGKQFKAWLVVVPLLLLETIQALKCPAISLAQSNMAAPCMIAVPCWQVRIRIAYLPFVTGDQWADYIALWNGLLEQHWRGILNGSIAPDQPLDLQSAGPRGTMWCYRFCLLRMTQTNTTTGTTRSMRRLIAFIPRNGQAPNPSKL
jgi:hypothetical protein